MNQPPVPGASTTTPDDRDQMMCQLGIPAPGPLRQKLRPRTYSLVVTVSDGKLTSKDTIVTIDGR